MFTHGNSVVVLDNNIRFGEPCLDITAGDFVRRRHPWGMVIHRCCVIARSIDNFDCMRQFFDNDFDFFQGGLCNCFGPGGNTGQGLALKPNAIFREDINLRLTVRQERCAWHIVSFDHAFYAVHRLSLGGINRNDPRVVLGRT